MSRRTLAAVAIATVGVTGVAGAAMAAAGNGYGNGNGSGNGSGDSSGNGSSSAERFGNGNATGNGNGNGNGHGNGNGTTAGSRTPLQDGSGRSTGGRGRAEGFRGNGLGGHGLGGHGIGAGQGPGTATHGADVPAAVPGVTISDEVAEMLAFMVQEEQLARDVYALAIDEHGDRVFVNINRAESNHMAEVQVLLDRYGIDDPTDGAGAGSFTDKELTGMYTDLEEQVSTDRAGAIAAGIAVETADIADLQDALKLEAPSDVTAVLQNLLAGSERHLAAFERNS